MPGKKAYPELVRNILNRYKYVLLVAVLGIVLLAWPSPDKNRTQVQEQAQDEIPDTDIEGVEEKLESLLSMKTLRTSCACCRKRRGPSAS